MVLKNDNYNDNNRDTTFWDTITDGTGSVAEVNQQLECTSNAINDRAGYVTVNTHYLAESDAVIDVNNDALGEQDLMFSLTKVVAGNPYGENNWVRVMKYRPTNQCYVQKKVGGVANTLYNAAWTGAAGSIRIRIASGTVYFYEEANLRHSCAWPLSSYNCYVYIFGRGSIVGAQMDEYDNFLATSIITKRRVLGVGL